MKGCSSKDRELSLDKVLEMKRALDAYGPMVPKKAPPPFAHVGAFWLGTKIYVRQPMVKDGELIVLDIEKAVELDARCFVFDAVIDAGIKEAVYCPENLWGVVLRSLGVAQLVDNLYAEGGTNA